MHKPPPPRLTRHHQPLPSHHKKRRVRRRSKHADTEWRIPDPPLGGREFAHLINASVWATWFLVLCDTTIDQPARWWLLAAALGFIGIGAVCAILIEITTRIINDYQKNKETHQ